jgi:hypothetical protein
LRRSRLRLGRPRVRHRCISGSWVGAAEHAPEIGPV